MKSKVNEKKKNQYLKSNNPQRKKTLILGDSIVKHVEGWRLNKWMKPTTKHHHEGCLKDSSLGNIILYHGDNNLKSGDNSEKSQAILST